MVISSASASTAPATPKVQPELLSIPLLFESNGGQFARETDFLSRGPGYALSIEGTQATLSVDVDGKTRHVSMKVANRCEASKGRGEDPASAVTNYFRGSDPSKWVTNVRTYKKVRYDEIYEGIDLVFHGTSNQLEYDFEVAPGIAPDSIAIDFGGVDDVRIDAAGDLVLELGGHHLRQMRPVAYQQNADGTRDEVRAAFTLLGERRIGFEIAEYDPSRELVIDPRIEFSTYVGVHTLRGIRVDALGNIYVVGFTGEYRIPAPVNGFQQKLALPENFNNDDVALMKLTPNANEILWATYLGGTDEDIPFGLEINGNGDSTIVGTTKSKDFPLTPGAFSRNGTVFATKINNTGSGLVYSTLIPAGELKDFTVDSDGRVVLVAEFDDISFLATQEKQPQARSGFETDAGVLRLNANGTALDFSIVFGSRAIDVPSAVVVDAQNNIYVAGATGGLDFPVLNAAQPDNATNNCLCADAFLTKFNTSGVMQFSTFWGGGSNESVNDLLLGTDNSVVILGGTSSSDFPLVAAANTQLGQFGFSGYLARFSTSGVPSMSTLLDVSPVRGIYNASGHLLLSEFTKVTVYQNPSATVKLWESPHISGANDVALHQGNFYWVGRGQFLHTQPVPLVVETGVDFNHHSFDRIVKVNMAAPTSELPRISTIYPEGGKSTGNREFAIISAQDIGFHEDSTVFFGDVEATNVFLDNGILRGRYPAKAEGRVDVTVVDPDENSSVLENAFTYVNPAMSIQSISVQRLLPPHDQFITITGTGFIPGALVSFTNAADQNGTELSNARVINSNTILARGVRVSEPGVYGIRVFNPHIYDFTPDPAFIAFKPAAIEVVGPTSLFVNPPTYTPEFENGNVTLSATAGTGLNSGMQVFIGGVAAPQVSFITENGSDRLKVDTPELDVRGPVDIQLVNGNDTMTFRNRFRFDDKQPVIREVRPPDGPPAGGTSVTLVGSGFRSDDIIQVGNILVTNKTFVDASTWLITTPPHHPGEAIVQVSNQRGGGRSVGPKFTYIGPVITGLRPTGGSINGGTSVEFFGNGFHANAVVKFGGVTASNVSTPFSTLTYTTPAHAAGLVDIEMTNPDGTKALLVKAFRFLGAGPTVTSISPNVGKAGTETFVTVVGTNFDSRARLEIGGGAARNVTVVDSTTITGTVPAFSDARTYDVVVRNPDGQTGLLEDGFTLKGGPKVDSVNPPSGPSTGGTTVTINGQGFDPAVQVQFGTTNAASVTFVSNTQVTAVTPAHVAGNVDVTLINPENLTGTRTNGFRFLPPPPTITSFTPNFAAPGEQVVITGTNFMFVTGVKFGTVTATFVVDSTTQITAIVPGGQATGQITVTTDSGSATSAATFTVDSTAPTVTNFTPTSGGGVSVTITGTRFTNATGVTFGGSSASQFTVVNATTITATAPNTGTNGPVCVTAPGSITGCSAAIFKFPPRVNGFTPIEGAIGANVTINGTNFEGATSVTFNGVSAGAFTVNPAGTEITTTVPAGAATGFVTVVTPVGSGTSSFKFGVAPSITSFSPVRGGPGSGVTITGLRFTNLTGVKFNGATATFTLVNDTTINAVVPAAATTGPITVTTTPGGTATSASSFTLANTPVITSFTPPKGTPGTSVALTGTNFDGATQVRFNGTPATFQLVSGTSINTTVPAAAMTGPISVTNAEGEGVSAALFYLPAVLSNFAPNAGAIGSNVTINGNNFNGATAVAFNGVAASFVVNAQDKITAVVPASASNGPITVTTPYGSVTSSFSFTVTSASTPTVTATAINTTQIFVTWTGDPTHLYEVRRIERATDRFTNSPIIRVTGNSFTDSGVVAGKTYLYNIMDTATGLIGNADSATTILFTDDPLNRGMVIKAVHLTQLRAAVNAMRVAAALPVRTWTDATPTLIRVIHINELRSALSEAYLQLSRHVTFSDEPLPPAMVVRAAHFSELRTATK